MECWQHHRVNCPDWRCQMRAQDKVEVVGSNAYHPDCTCANVRRIHETYCPKYVPAWRRRLTVGRNEPIVANKELVK